MEEMENWIGNILGVFHTAQKDIVKTSPWDILKDKNITEVTAMRQMSASYYRLMIALGAVGVLASLMVIGLKLMWAKNPQSRRDRKEELLFKVVSGIAIFSYVSLLGMLYKAVVKLA